MMRLTARQELEWVQTGTITCDVCHTRVWCSSPRVPLPYHKCEARKARRDAHVSSVPSKWRCPRAHVFDGLPETADYSNVVTAFAGHNTATSTERDVVSMIVSGVMNGFDGVTLHRLARQIIARVAGPSPLTTKEGALPDDARRIALLFEQSMNKETRD